MTSNQDIIKGIKEAYRSIKVDSASIERNRAKLLAYYKEQFPLVRKDIFFYFKPAFVVVAVLFFFVLSSSGLVVYAQKSLPGSNLYTLKRVYEKVVFVFTPASQKPVLRAELLAKRFNEFKDLIGQDGEKISPVFLQEATSNLEKEIIALKQELNTNEANQKYLSDLPILDNKKIIKALQNPEIDLDKILAETKEAIKDKNLKTAAEKIGEIEKIFSEKITEEEETVISEQPTENSNQTSSEKNNLLQPELETKPESVKPQVITPTQSTQTDFTIDVNFETDSSQK